MKMTREEILKEALNQVTGHREDNYGRPEYSFQKIANLWNAYFDFRIAFTPKDVAMMMALLKIARIYSGVKADSYIDLAGYAACAGEIDYCTQAVEGEDD